MASAASLPSTVPRRVWSATALLALGRQWGTLCTFLSIALLARALAPEDFGRFTFYLAVFGFLDVLVDCGTSTVAVQRGVNDPAAFAAAIAGGRRIRLVAALLGAAGVAGAALLGGERELGWVALAALGPLARVPELSAVVFQREIAWGRPVLLRALGSTARLAAIAALALAGVSGFGPYLLAYSWAIAAGNVALHFVARPHLPRAAPAPIAGLLRAAWMLALTGLLQQAYFHVDNLFVRALCGPAELGRYNASVRLFLWLVFFAAFATTSALPWLARRHQERELGDAAVRLAQPLFALACGGVGLVWPWSGELLRLAFGPGFEAAAPSLRWLLAATVAVYLGASFLTAVIASGRARAALAIAVAALFVNLAANALLVPRFGIEGAAAVTLLTEGAVAALAAFALVRGGARLGAQPAAWLAGPLALALTGLASLGLHAWLAPSLAGSG